MKGQTDLKAVLGLASQPQWTLLRVPVHKSVVYLGLFVFVQKLSPKLYIFTVVGVNKLNWHLLTSMSQLT